MSLETSSRRKTTTSNYEKYQTNNPIVRSLIERFISTLMSEVDRLKPTSVIDLGCGEGMLATEFAERPYPVSYRGYDINPDALGIARSRHPDLQFELADFLTLTPESDEAELVTCLEVLEHLPYPREALDTIRGLTRSHAIISVPWEPYFRIGNFLRGKYVTQLGNHPEHINHFSPSSFRALVAEVFAEVRIIKSFPWIIAVGKI